MKRERTPTALMVKTRELRNLRDMLLALGGVSRLRLEQGWDVMRKG